jgi:hypothetical protein
VIPFYYLGAEKNQIDSKLQKLYFSSFGALKSMKQENCKEESIDEKTIGSSIGMYHGSINGSLQWRGRRSKRGGACG